MATPDETHEAHPSAAHDALAWGGLCVLTLASFGAHYLPLGALAPAVAFGIAVAKAAIVLYFFMHLAEESTSVRVLVVLSALWVGLLCAGIVLDTGFR